MSETLTIVAKNVFISGDNIVHADFYPANIGIEDAVMHGAEISYAGSTPELAVDGYMSTARAEILRYLNGAYPNQYD